MKKIICLLMVFTLLFLPTASYAFSETSLTPIEESGVVSADNFMEFVKLFIERRTQTLVEAQKEISQLVVYNGNIQETADVSVVEEWALAELNERRDALRQWGEAYTNHKTELTLKHADINMEKAELEVEEFTKLYYEKIRGDEPEYTAWVVNRKFIFEKGRNGWGLVSQKLLNDFGPAPINEPTGTTKNEMLTALSRVNSLQFDEKDVKLRALDLENLHGMVDTVIQSTFNRQAAKEYAVQYWRNYNPAYRSFDKDCTNFISQAMRAGGWTDVTGWYRDPKHWWYNILNQTWSWVGVPYWYEFALNHSKRTTLLSNPKSLWEGEVLQVDFTFDGTKDHTMIVTRRTSSEIYLTYHTTDTFERSFASLSTAYPNARWLAHLVFSSF
jgi:hypothetical protein